MTSVALAVMGYRDNVPYILESIRVCRDYVDQIQVLGPTDNDAFTDKQQTQLLDAMGSVSGGVSGYPWHDDFSEYKNALLVPISTDWVAVFDADEIPTPELAANLKILISKAKSQGANLVYLKAINITHERDGKQTMHLSDGKPNLHENIPNPYYGDVHIWLKPGYFPWKSFHSRYAYYHIKTWEENYTRAIRNVFCVLPKQTVLTDTIPKIFESLSTADSITGSSLDKIEKTFSHQYSGSTFEIKGMGLLPFTVTADHPVLIQELMWSHSWDGRRMVYQKLFGNRTFKAAKDLVAGHLLEPARNRNQEAVDHLVFPKLRQERSIDSISLTEFYKIPGRRNKQKINALFGSSIFERYGQNKNSKIIATIPINEETAELFGYYLAEGSTGIDRGGVRLNFGSHEIALTERAQEIVTNYFPYKVKISTTPPSSRIVAFGGNPLGRFCKHYFGKKAREKRIPNWILFNRKKILFAFLLGYFRGDGNIHRGDGFRHLPHRVMTTASRVLALQLQYAFSKFDLFASIEEDKREGLFNFNGKLVHQHDRYLVRVNERIKKRKFVQDNDAFYLPIRTVRPLTYSGPVYNVQTKSNVFCLSNVLTHNCGGGGDTWKDNDPFGYHHWSKVRAIAKKDGIKNYKDLLVRIREGTISQELKEWMKWVRELKWHDGELKAWCEYWNLIHENDKL